MMDEATQSDALRAPHNAPVTEREGYRQTDGQTDRKTDRQAD